MHSQFYEKKNRVLSSSTNSGSHCSMDNPTKLAIFKATSGANDDGTALQYLEATKSDLLAATLRGKAMEFEAGAEMVQIASEAMELLGGLSPLGGAPRAPCAGLCQHIARLR